MKSQKILELNKAVQIIIGLNIGLITSTKDVQVSDIIV